MKIKTDKSVVRRAVTVFCAKPFWRPGMTRDTTNRARSAHEIAAAKAKPPTRAFKDCASTSWATRTTCSDMV